jgi:hypothetical protein
LAEYLAAPVSIDWGVFYCKNKAKASIFVIPACSSPAVPLADLSAFIS